MHGGGTERRSTGPATAGLRAGILLALLAAAAVLPGCGAPPEGRPDAPPNILLIVADDLGYSDLGSFGAVHIETPHLDRLAREGLRFTQFYNMAKCEPTRSTLFSGLFTEKRHAGNARALPQLLREAGYYTAISGKEHFAAWYPDHLYAEHVFDDAFVYDVINSYFVPPEGRFENPFRLNGDTLDLSEIPHGDAPFYKTDVVADYALRFLDEAGRSDRPFFLYVPFHVPHYPLQARAEDVEKYEGRFADGWDRLRRDRFARQQALGLMPPGARLAEPEDNVYPHRGSEAWARYDPWSSIPEAERADYAREMAVYAAMIDRLDRNVGRLVERLEALGEADDTLILFFSDNGACPFDNGGYTGHGDPAFGAPGSYAYQRPEWAAAANTPFRFFKQYGHEGGAHTPFIARWPGRIAPGGVSHHVGHVADVLPTLLDAAGVAYPDAVDAGPTPALDGVSLLPAFRGRAADDDRLVVSGFGSDKRMVRAGDWKIVRVKDGPWELYHLAEDPAETVDLAGEQPDRVRALLQRFDAWRDEQGAVF